MDILDGKHFPWKGKNKICDTRDKASNKLNKRSMNVYKGSYKMASCTFDIMIKKGVNIKVESYDLLRNFRHHNAIPLLDFYVEPDNPNHGRLVIPKVHSTFKAWFENGGKSMLFDKVGHMTPVLQTMLIEFSDLIASLHKQGLVIERLIMDEDLYVNVYDGLPKLCILLCQVKKVIHLGRVDEKRNWDYVREFLSECEGRCLVQRDHLTKKFCKFIGTEDFTIERLKKYPHNWGYEMKGKYLMALVAADHGKMMTAFVGIDWPYQKKKRITDNLPKLLRMILEWEEKANGRRYNTLNFFEYIILLRNCYKHVEKMTGELKHALMDREAIIDMTEKWMTDFWTTVYERVEVTLFIRAPTVTLSG